MARGEMQPIQSEAFMDEAPVMVADPQRIEAWAEHAKAGDEFVYASRAGMFAANNPSLAMARALHQLKLVELIQRPIKGSFQRNYVARRTAVPIRAAVPRERGAARDFVEDEAAAIDAVLPLIARAARFGRPCPTDVQLAERARLERSEIKPLLEAMETLGLIRVQAAPAPTLRMITIVATGHRTGLAS